MKWTFKIEYKNINQRSRDNCSKNVNTDLHANVDEVSIENQDQE